MSETLDPLELTLFGATKLRWQGVLLPTPQPKLCALLGILAWHPEGVARDQLALLLWGSGGGPNLRQALYTLRRLPGGHSWLRSGEHVQLSAVTDVMRFRCAQSEGRHAAALESWPRELAEQTFLEGVVLEGPPEFGEWLDMVRAELETQYVGALHAHTEELAASGQLRDALQAAERLVLRAPWDERAQHLLMRLQARATGEEGVLAAFERYRLWLRQEVQGEPSVGTLSLLQELIDAEPPRGRRAQLVKAAEAVPSLPQRLLGREEALGSLRAVLAAQGRALVTGMGGAGKSALAATVAQEHLQSSRGKVVWQEVGNDPPDAVQDALVTAIGAQTEFLRVPLKDRDEWLRTRLQREGVSLVILDDVWNPYTLARGTDFIPQGGALLMTSRYRYPGWPQITVGRLSRAAALSVLAFYADQELSDGPAVQGVCAALGDLAFALRLAGITLRTNQWSSEQLLAHVRETPLALRAPGVREERGITALLDASVQNLDPAAYETLLGLGGLFASRSTATLLARALRRAEPETEAALYRLVERGLAERSAYPGRDVITFVLHELVHAYVRPREILLLQHAREAVLAFVEAHIQNFEVLDVELPNILGAAESARGHDDDVLVALLERLTVWSDFLGARGQTPRLTALLRDAAQRARDPASAHRLWGRVGDVQQNFHGDFEAAGEAYTLAATLAAQVGQAGRELVYRSNLGVVLNRAGRQGADVILDDALARARALGDPLTLSIVVEQRGFVLGSRGQMQEANTLLTEALTLLGQLPGEDDELVRRRFFTLSNLGETEFLLNRPEAALARKRTALELAELHDHHVWQAHAQNDIGKILHAQGELETARLHLSAALGIYLDHGVTSNARRLASFMREAGYPVPEGELTAS